MASPELVLHPVRLRVVQALLGGRDLTTADLRALLPDVATATLYRQVSVLVSAGVLAVVDEHRVRGAVERTYRLVPGAATVEPEQLRQMAPEQHRRGFHTFVASLLAGFDRYLRRWGDAEGRVDPVADRLVYRQTVLHLSDEELDDLLGDLSALLARVQGTPPGPGRHRRAVAFVVLKE